MNERAGMDEVQDNRAVAGKLRAEADRLERAPYVDGMAKAATGYGTGGGIPGNAAQACSARMPARTSLLQRAMHMRRQAAELEALARAIPENFPFDADSALYLLIGKAGL